MLFLKIPVPCTFPIPIGKRPTTNRRKTTDTPKELPTHKKCFLLRLGSRSRLLCSLVRISCDFCCFVCIHTNHNVTTSKVVKVICERTYTVIYTRRIPTLLKLNSIGLYLPLVQQVIYVYCKFRNK